MTHIIAQPCIGTKDTACVTVCPVDCIHPTKDEPDFAAAEKHGVKTDGGTAAGPGAKVLAELAGLIAGGHLEVPIANVYSLAQVREAYTELERRHSSRLNLHSERHDA